MSGLATATSDPYDRPIFAARLMPYRSLGRQGFIGLMLAVGAINLGGAVVFFAAGAWPVLPFLGLDVLIIFLAFRANYLSARAFEEVIVSPIAVVVRRVDPRGRRSEWRFNPAWTRLTVVRDPEDQVVTLMTLEEGRRRVEIAGLMPPVEREDFARALSGALAAARRGPDFSASHP